MSDVQWVYYEVSGLNEAIQRIARSARILPIEIKRAVRLSGFLVERRMKLNLSGPAHLKYAYRDAGTKARRMEALITGEDTSRILTSNRRRGGSRYSVTSNTNPYPGTRTGNLKNSVDSRSQDSGFATAIGPSAAYGTYLEFGTKKMQPYPFVGPTLEQTRDDIIAEFQDAVRRSVQ